MCCPKFKLHLLANIVLFNLILISGLQAAPYSSRVVGMKFAEVPFPGNYRMSVLNMTAAPGGGEVAVLVRSSAKKIIAVDRGKTNKGLSSWKTGVANKKTPVNNDIIQVGHFPKISKDASAVMVTFKYKILPDVHVSHIHTSGHIFIKSAVSQINVIKKGFKLKAGNVLKIGPVQMTYIKSGKPQWGKEPLEITFDVTGEFDQLANIKFFHANGSEIKSASSGRMTMSMGSFKKMTVSYRLSEKVDRFMVKANYWNGLEVVKVPVVIDVKRMF